MGPFEKKIKWAFFFMHLLLDYLVISISQIENYGINTIRWKSR